MYKLTHGRRVI